MTLEILTADCLAPIQHGFFTRRGGASSGVFSGLNCGTGSTDQTEIVAINRSRVAAAMDVPVKCLMGVHQVHSADVVHITNSHSEKSRADGMVTKTPGLALSVLTADCQPVLFCDHAAGVIGAAHAGWRGALNGILEATMDAMESIGARRENITAVIGPSISQAAYEVGPEFLEDFLMEDTDYSRFFIQGINDRYLFDLPGFGLFRMREYGVGHAEWTRHCTYSDPDRFFSYRRTVHSKEADYGRLIAAIRL
jgi:YfiH family protein